MSQNTFGALGVPVPLIDSLAERGITSPFPVQVKTLPDTLAGHDVLGRGQTGSGKTLAFALPLVTRLAQGSADGRSGRRGARPNRPRGLVLAPTRELATQITATIEPLAAAVGLTVTTIFGGVNQHRQVVALRGGVDIVVACPGRLDDLMKQGHVTLDEVVITVLDEADHMADLGFLPVVSRIMDKTPAKGQRLLFSATLDNGVDKLVKRFLHDERRHSVASEASPVEAMTHRVFTVADPTVKKDVVKTLASGSGKRILFMRTKHQAKKLARQLTSQGIPSVDLHGNLSQGQRDRNLQAFSEGSSRVLVATDVAARGVHVDDVELVIHVDPPAEHKSYLHRSGRTARAGAEGSVLTLVLPDQRRDTEQMMRKAKISASPEPVTATSDVLLDLVGEIAPFVEPTAPQPQGQRGGQQPQGSRGGRGGGQRGGRGSGQGGRGRAGGGRDDSGRSGGRGAGQSGGRNAGQSGGRNAGQSGGRSAEAGGSRGRRGGQGGQGASQGQTSGRGTRGGSAPVYSTSTGGRQDSGRGTTAAGRAAVGAGSRSGSSAGGSLAAFSAGGRSGGSRRGGGRGGR